MNRNANIVVTEQISGAGLERLKRKYALTVDGDLWKNKQKFIAQYSDAHAIIIRNQTQVTEELLEHCPNLLVIGRAGVGYDNIDIEAANQRGIVVCYTPNENAVSTAEHTFALMLALARKVPLAHFSTSNGRWDRQRMVGTELFQKTLGILGLGKIGFRVAMRAKAFGMRILAFDKFISTSQPAVTETGAELTSLSALLKNSDFVTNHLPVTEDTLELLGYNQFKHMKSTAFFINAARGQTVNEKDLIAALKKNLIAGAALDVRETEPPGESPLNQMDNVVLTHILPHGR